MKRTGMNDIKDILRQRHDLDLTRDQIAAATGVSAGTVSHVLERAAAAGLSWPLRILAGAPPSTGCGCSRATSLRSCARARLLPDSARARCTHDRASR